MKESFDYIVVGSGLAGLYSALMAARYGKVILVTKAELTDSNSYNAQGGIAAVADKNDIPEYHFEDTVIAGRGLCDYPSVNILVNEGPELIRDIISMGMKFDVTESGELALGLEGGHHRRRILHAGGDATGRMVTSFIMEQVRKEPAITILPHASVMDILVTDGRCDGVRCWNFKHNREMLIFGKNTILASGGSAAIYKRSTNPSTTTGDGVAIAYNAGCLIEDMEFVQFHPTAIVHPEADSFLVSEAVRGEGAHLLNTKGERFMLGAHELAELAPRDVVAQKIDEQIRAEGKGYVWLSLSHLDPQAIKDRFPTIYAKCASLGIDMCERIPIAPAAHYTVGGVVCDHNAQSSISHLYICGELASTGIMGANRLASNSLIECLVFGRRAIVHAASRQDNAREDCYGVYRKNLTIDSSSKDIYDEIRACVADIISEHAGIVRNRQSLEEGIAKAQVLRKRLGGADNEVYTKLASNLLTTATLIMNGALFREESRGCHFRSDFPSEREEFHCHSIQHKGSPIAKKEVKLNK